MQLRFKLPVELTFVLGHSPVTTPRRMICGDLDTPIPGNGRYVVRHAQGRLHTIRPVVLDAVCQLEWRSDDLDVIGSRHHCLGRALLHFLPSWD